MKSRKDAVYFVSRQFNRGPGYDMKDKPGDFCHYGLVDLRELMDFIYEGSPTSEHELLFKREDAGRLPQDLTNAIGRVKRMRNAKQRDENKKKAAEYDKSMKEDHIFRMNSGVINLPPINIKAHESVKEFETNILNEINILKRMKED